MTSDNRQHPRRLLVTGATGGMGRACTLAAVEQGYQVVLADLSAPKLEQLAADCVQQGGSAQCHTLDVTQPDTVAALAAALGAGGGIDGIIHTVGISPQMGGWERIIEVDLVGTTAFLEAVRPHLKPGCCAVAITSMSAYMCPPNPELEGVLSRPLAPDFAARLKPLQAQLEHPGLAYSYAKRALKQYVAEQAMAWGKEGKRFVSLSPGLIDTEMGRLENNAMENFDAMRSLVALGRLGEPEDIASTALFLVSPLAAYISGCDILVDGGFVGSFSAMQRQSSPS
ncbi:MAG: SDR family oxidoreductase [Gammaproteobacteria bacterium]|nr:SDR family oxidoreductase [Gammaproteobacteria bacterium]